VASLRDYPELYGAKRLKKVEKLAKQLRREITP
jgi:hypothetical protein